MPYKGLSFLKGKITEPCVKEWADELRPGAKTTLYSVLKFLEWVQNEENKKKEDFPRFPSAKAMLDDQKRCRKSDDEDEEYKHLKMVKKYIASKKYLTGPHKGEKVGTADRKATYAAIRNFYAYFHRDLPQFRTGEFETLFAATELDGRRAGELTPLTAEDARRFALALPQPWRAVVVVMVQGALGEAEFEQFNRSLWRSILKDLNKPGPVKVAGLIRQKTAARQAAHKGKVPVYYTFLGKDAKDQIKEWLKVRPKTSLPHLFVVRQMDAANRTKGEWTPVVANTIQKNTTLWAKRSGLVEDSDLNRYRIHAHEVRDLFRTLCSAYGVSKVAAEYFMGHDIDRLRYDKSPEVFPDLYRNEYRKVEPHLNILSMPAMGGEEEAKRAAREEFVRMRLQFEKVPESEYASKDLASMPVDEVNELIRTKGAQSTTAATNGGRPVQNGRTQKVVPMVEVERWVERGWEFVTRLPTGNAVIRQL